MRDLRVRPSVALVPQLRHQIFKINLAGALPFVGHRCRTCTGGESTGAGVSDE